MYYFFCLSCLAMNVCIAWPYKPQEEWEQKRWDSSGKPHDITSFTAIGCFQREQCLKANQQPSLTSIKT